MFKDINLIKYCIYPWINKKKIMKMQRKIKEKDSLSLFITILEEFI